MRLLARLLPWLLGTVVIIGLALADYLVTLPIPPSRIALFLVVVGVVVFTLLQTGKPSS